jgi:hypothetical protein
MRLLRLLAALVGGTLHRLGQALRSWAGVGTSGDDERARDQNGPPEHWLRYVRERAPWLLAGKSLPTHSAPAPRRAPVVPSRPAAVVTAAAARPAPAPAPASALASTRAPASASVPAAPAHARAPAQTRPVQHPAPAIRTVAQPRLTSQRPRLETRETETREIEQRSSDDARVTPLVAPSIVPSPTPERRETPRPGGGRFARVHSSVVPISAPIESWPSLPPPAFRLDAGEAATRPPPVPRDESEAPVMFDSAPEDETRPPPPAMPPAQVEADDVGSWADLPDKGFEAWQVQSIRSLLREQLHLARLLAEQEGAGSSWSAPHS